MKIGGCIFAVREKKNERGPDYTGNGKDESGKEYRFAGWKKIDKNGKAYLSLSLEDQADKQSDAFGRAPSKSEDLPF